jgi:hypothetical protein
LVWLWGGVALAFAAMSVGIPVQDQELMPQCRILEEQMTP